MIITIVSIIITTACLSLLLSIVGKRWNALQSIDLESLPAEQQRRVKKKILTERLKRQYHQVKVRVGVIVLPVIQLLGEHLTRIGTSFLHKPAAPPEQEEGGGPTPRIEHALSEAERLFESGEYEKAEKKYIDIIARDAKNLSAYEGLSLMYLRQKEWVSAREVLEFLCTHLRELVKREGDAAARSAAEMSLAEWLRELAAVYQSTGKGEQAEAAMVECLELQPQNPKFLDASLEMYIILGKKREARAALSRLRETNPENQKLSELETRIDNL